MGVSVHGSTFDRVDISAFSLMDDQYGPEWRNSSQARDPNQVVVLALLEEKYMSGTRTRQVARVIETITRDEAERRRLPIFFFDSDDDEEEEEEEEDSEGDNPFTAPQPPAAQLQTGESFMWITNAETGRSRWEVGGPHGPRRPAVFEDPPTESQKPLAGGQSNAPARHVG